MPNTTDKKSIFGERCSHPECNKKLKLTDVLCRCEKRFCDRHRYAETHNCTFNYQLSAKQELARKNPLVIGEKIPTVI